MNTGLLIMLLLGGLALFLHGMTIMTEGLKAAAGSRMKTFLKGMTRNRWTSLIAGTGITAVIQSSSITTVLAVGFVSAGLLSFQSTLGLILGANLGTTITAQIIAFKITKASWAMVAIGYLLSAVFSKQSIKEFGTIILGLGLVFLGMDVMSNATEPLKTYDPFINAMKGLDNYIISIAIGACFTALVQSSSATTGIVIVLASQNLISINGGVAIILGANIGTCVTAVLSALGKPREAMRVAISHVFFNVAGVLLWYAFIDQLTDLVNLIPGNAARQIANAHTIFNIANTVIFIWMVNPIAKLVLIILPAPKKETDRIFPKLHSYYLEDPSTAIELGHTSIAKLGKRTSKILKIGLDVALKGNAKELGELRENDKTIDQGHAEILQFLQLLQGHKLSKKQIKQLEKDIEAVNVLESTADLITTNLVEAAEHRLENKFSVSENTLLKLQSLYEEAFIAFKYALQKYGGKTLPNDNSIDKTDFKEQLHQVRSHLMTRLAETDENRIEIFRFESEVLEATRRLHGLARRLERKS